MEQKKFIQTRPTDYILFSWLYRLLFLQLILLTSNYILKVILSIMISPLQSGSSFIPSIFIGYWCIFVFFFFSKFIKPSPLPGDLSLEFEENELKLLDKHEEILIPYGDITSVVVSISNPGTYHSIKLQVGEKTFTLAFFTELEAILQLLAHKVSEDCPIVLKKDYLITTYRAGLFNLLLLVFNLNFIISIFSQQSYLPSEFPILIGVFIYLFSFFPEKCTRSIPTSYRPLPSNEEFIAGNKVKPIKTKLMILHKVFVYQLGFVFAIFSAQILLASLDAENSYSLLATFSVLIVTLLVLILLAFYHYLKKYLVLGSTLIVGEEGMTFIHDDKTQTYQYKDFIKVKAYRLKSGKFQGILCHTTTETFFLSEFENLEKVFEHFKLRLPSVCAINSQKLFLSSTTSFRCANLFLLFCNVSLLVNYISSVLMPSSYPATGLFFPAIVVILALIVALIIKLSESKTSTKLLTIGTKIYIICILLLLAAIMTSTLMS